MTSVIRNPCDELAIQSGVTDSPCARRAEPWVLATTILGSSMAFLDGTVVNVALPSIQAHLHASASEAQWIVEAYALTLGALLLAGGSLGDRYGRRGIFGLGMLMFALASLSCGLASSVAVLIAARGVQGIGGAMMVPGSLSLISSSFPPERRGRAIGTWSGATAITSAFGPLLGGWLADAGLWRWIFFVNLPLAAAALVILYAKVGKSSVGSPADRFDWPGAMLATVGLGGVVAALIESSGSGWAAVRVWLPAVAGSLALAAFVAVEMRSRSPMVPLDLFRSRTFAGTNILTLLLYAALGGSLFFLPFVLIRVHGYSATAAGAAILPFILLISIFSRWSGGLVERFGARRPLVVGPLLAAGGFALLALPGLDAGSYWTSFFPGVVVLGAGMTISVAPLTTAVMGSVDVRLAGAASGINNAVSRVAGLVAVAALGVLLLGIQAHELASSPPSSPVRTLLDTGRVGFGSLEVPDGISEDDAEALRLAVDTAFVDGFRGVMLAAAALAALGALSAFLLVKDARAGASTEARD